MRTSIGTHLAWSLSVTLLACGASQGAATGSSGANSGSGGDSSGETGTGGRDTAGASSGEATATDGTGGMGGMGAATGGPAGLGGASSGGASSGAGDSSSGGSAAGDAVGGASGGGGSTGGDLPGIDSVSRVTIRSKSANLDANTGECYAAAPGFEDDAAWSSWSFERATNTFGWEYCKGYPGMWESSSRVLSDAEAQGILNALTLIAPSEGGRCFSDDSQAELELEVDGVKTLYRPDTGWCGSEPDGVNYVRGMHSLWAWFETLADPFVLPAAPAQLTLYTGEIPSGPFPNAECSKNPLPVEYELDVQARMLSWRGMSSESDSGGTITYCPTETRLLESAELDTVLAAYEMLALGARPCDALERPPSLDDPRGQIPWMEVANETLVDETDSCYGGSSRPYTIGVAALARVVAALTE